MELKEKCDTAVGAGAVVVDPAVLLQGAAEPAAPAEGQPYPVPRPVEVTAREIRRYEDLDGADGRSVFFRPHRYTAEDLAPLRGTVTVTVGAERRDFPLLDISQSGVAVAWPEAPVRARQRLPVTVRFDAHVAFRGDAVVGSVRDDDGTTLVGLSFNDFLLDVEEVLQLRTVKAWSPRGAAGAEAVRPWQLGGGERFKSEVAELRLFLEDSRQELDALEADLPWQVLHGSEHPARAALVSRLRSEFVAEAVRLSESVDAAVRELPEAHACAAAKAWSLRHVHEFLMQAPILHRARHKPFGYPGDYEVMNFIYTKNFEGSSLFARAVSLAFTQTRSAQAVRYRKDLVKRQLQALLARRAGSTQPVRILSIAAGPAQELFELFEEADEIPVPLEVVLFEQDRNALTHAWNRLRSSVEGRFSGRVKLTFLHDSIKRLLRDAALFAPFGEFDLVFSCGLYDYLAHKTAVILTRRLSRSVRPGGRLLIANMVDHPTRWIMEHHLDWPLIYRTRETLLQIGRDAVPGAAIKLLEEESGANPFFELVRP